VDDAKQKLEDFEEKARRADVPGRRAEFEARAISYLWGGPAREGAP
jgi:hypothetical protein